MNSFGQGVCRLSAAGIRRPIWFIALARFPLVSGDSTSPCRMFVGVGQALRTAGSRHLTARITNSSQCLM